ncbi:conserved hypothetical protein [Talaromyces stipitatus ATCC 10500]|uniref:Uncharacterized protein n=1 Tax=Talaromyces stipitatus (strain ATCC 10500 / CBS 375.48 / QM 6759 / NRRL 1006) TaxID=441959 RepID=B8MPQ3_TALSN|nr:uncharacterized protein TSTA_107000 [Talaromyces stipitatus ATCC 10500]EED14492.1 conserved hypothetical protein [Talaromyces stipitatus ATCC 10500]
MALKREKKRRIRKKPLSLDLPNEKEASPRTIATKEDQAAQENARKDDKRLQKQLLKEGREQEKQKRDQIRQQIREERAQQAAEKQRQKLEQKAVKEADLQLKKCPDYSEAPYEPNEPKFKEIESQTE